MPVLIHGSMSEFWMAVALTVWIVAMKCAAMDVSDLRQLVQTAILQCLELAQIPIKEAASLAGMTDTHFRKALSGDGGRHLGLLHLLNLPYRFWLHFGPQLMWMVAKKHAAEIAESFSFARRA
jgi:hypothetical protein